MAAGQSLTLDVHVSGITDLYAFQFDVAFNPARLAATAVTEGVLFSSRGVAFSPGFVDNTAGVITFIAETLSGPGPGLGDAGSLASIAFHASAPGMVSVGVANVILLDSTLADILASAVGGTVTITPAAVPEPSTAGMLGLGVLAGVVFVTCRTRVGLYRGCKTDWHTVR